jgi:hypothetical protein
MESKEKVPPFSGDGSFSFRAPNAVATDSWGIFSLRMWGTRSKTVRDSQPVTGTSKRKEN